MKALVAAMAEMVAPLFMLNDEKPKGRKPHDPQVCAREVASLEKKLREARRDAGRYKRQAEKLADELEACRELNEKKPEPAPPKKLQAGMTLKEVNEFLKLTGTLKWRSDDGDEYEWRWVEQRRVYTKTTYPPVWHYETVTTKVVKCYFDSNGKLVEWEETH